MSRGISMQRFSLCWDGRNNTEWVTWQDREDPEARLTFTRDTNGAQSKQLPLGSVAIAHANVEMPLLRTRRVRPA
jgi:hypothetical protein